MKPYYHLRSKQKSPSKMTGWRADLSNLGMPNCYHIVPDLPLFVVVTAPSCISQQPIPAHKRNLPLRRVCRAWGWAFRQRVSRGGFTLLPSRSLSLDDVPIWGLAPPPARPRSGRQAALKSPGPLGAL